MFWIIAVMNMNKPSPQSYYKLEDWFVCRDLRYYRIGIKNPILWPKSIVSVSYQYQNFSLESISISIGIEILDIESISISIGIKFLDIKSRA